MPLDRSHLTVALRIMLPVYPAFALAVGLSLTLTPVARLLETPTFAYADHIVPLRAWGVGFLLVAAALIGALATRRPTAFAGSLAVMALWLASWAVLNFASAVDGDASWSAWTWPAFVATACFATMSSLLSQEV